MRVSLNLVARYNGEVSHIELVDGVQRIEFCDVCGDVWPIMSLSYVSGPDDFECPLCIHAH